MQWYREGTPQEKKNDELRIPTVTKSKWLRVVPMEPDYEAAATQMNVLGWTCTMHEPGAWCVDCKEMQMRAARAMVDAALKRDT